MVKYFFKILFLLAACIFCIKQPVHGNLNETKQSLPLLDSVQLYESAYRISMNNGDTVRAIVLLTKLGDIYSHKAQYAQAYEYFWNALLLADTIHDSILLAQVHSGIGWLYSFYERRDEALHHFNMSIALKKKLIAKGIIGSEELVSDYYSITTLYRELEEYEWSKTYLDSCYILYYNIDNKSSIKPYLEAERAYYYIYSNSFKKALDIIETIRPWFVENQPSYLIVLNTFTGDAYKGLLCYKQSEVLYEQALYWAITYTRHVNYIPTIHQRLADLYFITGNYKKAFMSLNTAKAKTEELFDSRSMNNRPLLEITDEFRNEKEEKRLLLQAQRLTKLEHEKRVRVLQNIILLGVLFLVIIISAFYFRYIKLKHKTREELNTKQQELELINTRELIQLKNRELASSALRLIEKDKFLQQLKDKITDFNRSTDVTEIKRLFKSVSLNNNQNWKEFEARFIEVNGQFYKQLKSLHPELTPGDLKICALIKLNFNSKEMASLMGIGNESVHTIRYRLRKKLGLTRKDNLTEYLFNVDTLSA